MSETFPTEIWLGCAVRRERVPALIRAINAAELQDEWGSPIVEIETEAELLEYRNEEGLLWFCHIEQRWGTFEDLEAFLVEQKIAFDRRHEPVYEYSGELVQYRPDFDSPLVTEANSGGNAVVQVIELKEIRDTLTKCQTMDDVAATIERLSALCSSEDVPPLEPFRVTD